MTSIVAALAAIIAALAGDAACAQPGFPARAVRFVVPFIRKNNIVVD